MAPPSPLGAPPSPLNMAPPGPLGAPPSPLNMAPPGPLGAPPSPLNMAPPSPLGAPPSPRSRPWTSRHHLLLTRSTRSRVDTAAASASAEKPPKKPRTSFDPADADSSERSVKLLASLAKYLEDCGGSAEMIKGWYTKTEFRKNGATAGDSDSYFFNTQVSGSTAPSCAQPRAHSPAGLEPSPAPPCPHLRRASASALAPRSRAISTWRPLPARRCRRRCVDTCRCQASRRATCTCPPG